MAMEEWTVTDAKTIDVDTVHDVRATLARGRCSVLVHDEPTTRVEIAAVTGRELRVSLDGNTLVIDQVQTPWSQILKQFKQIKDDSSADITVLVPREVAVSLSSIRADLLVSGDVRAVRARTISGSIATHGTTGQVDCQSVSGELSIVDHDGAVHTNTVSGEVGISGAIERATVNSVSGDIMLDVTTGHPFSVASNTISGDFTLRLPEGLGAQYTFNSVSGAIQLGPERITGLRGRGFTRTDGDSGAARTSVKANSVSGSLTVLRRDATSPASADDGARGDADASFTEGAGAAS